jgi:hypothetical protein
VEAHLQHGVWRNIGVIAYIVVLVIIAFSCDSHNFFS